MIPTLPPLFARVLWGVIGLLVGSFLNVVIHRYPLADESVSHPRRSRCPSCRTTLSWRENIPLFSWLVQRGRCRHCRWPIPFRYPLVEALTCALFSMAAWWTPAEDWGLRLIRSVVLAGLVVATFVDFDCFEIPDSVSIGGMLLAPIASFAIPALHLDGPLARMLSEGQAAPAVDRFGALMNSLAGLAVGWGILWTIGWVGRKALGREAMGFGDVKLLAAGGGFVGPGAALVALVVASFLASVVGVLNIARIYCFLARRGRQRGRRRSFAATYRVAHAWGGMLPFGPYLALGIGIVLLRWNDMPW